MAPPVAPAAPAGLRLIVFRAAMFAGCSRGGVSEVADRLTLVGTVDRRENFANRQVCPLPMAGLPADASAPAVVLVVRRGPTFHLEPLDGFGGGKWRMAGGAYAATSDSRWGDTLRRFGSHGYFAVAVHDRTE